MPTITALCQSLLVRGCPPEGQRPALYAISVTQSHYKRLDLSFDLLKYVADLDHFCNGIAACEDLQAIYMHHNSDRLSYEVLSKFYLALSLCPKLELLDLGRNDYWDNRFRKLEYDLEYARALPVNLCFENLKIFSLHTVTFRANGVNYFQFLGHFLSRCPNLHTVRLCQTNLVNVLPISLLELANLGLLANALSQAPNLKTLDLRGNRLFWLTTERFIEFCANLAKCRALTEIIGIEEFAQQHKDALKKILNLNKKQIPLIQTFNSSSTLPDPVKKIVLEYVVPKNALPIIFSKIKPKDPLGQICYSLEQQCKITRIWDIRPISM